MEISQANIKDRKGEIVIARKFITDMNECYKYFSLVFKNFIPLEIDRNNFNDDFIYRGVSPYFREITQVEVLPQYDVRLTNEADGIITVKFVEIKN